MKIIILFPILCLLVSCMPGNTTWNDASFSLPLKLWPQLAENPQVFRFFLEQKGYSTIVLDQKGDDLDSFRLEYPENRQKELVKKCSGRFGNPKIQNPAAELAVWSIAECNAVLMITYERDENMTKLIFIKRRQYNSFQCPYIQMNSPGAEHTGDRESGNNVELTK